MKSNTAYDAQSAASRSLRKTAHRGLTLASAAILGFSTVFTQGIALPDRAQAQTEGRNYVKLKISDARRTKKMQLGLNKSIVVDLPADAHDILVANPDVADAVTRTSRRIYLFGKQIGQTNIFVFDGRGKQIASLELSIERDISGLEDTIRRLIPNSDVKAEMINDSLVLTGYVATPQDSATAMRLARVFVEGRESGDDSGSGAPGQITITGGEEESDDEAPDPIINMLKIDGEDQVHLKVVVAEIQRSVVKQLGIEPDLFNASSNIGGGSDGFGFQVLSASSPSLDMFGVGAGGLQVTNGLGGFNARYRAMERTGVMRTLAEPSLTAISGEKAHFKVGGEYNIPESVDGDKITFRVVEYGVALSFVPVVLTQGRISLKIRTEVKEPTAQGVYSLGERVNLLNVRQRLADTTVELPSGGSMVIAGLVQDNVRQAVNGQPLLKDIPFFGTLFRSREFVRDESEVVVIVTPYLVKPTGRRALATPDKNFQPASDTTGYLMGRINRVYGTKQGKLPKGRYTGSVGFIFK